MVIVFIVVLFMWLYSCSLDRQFDYLYEQQQQQQQLGEKWIQHQKVNVGLFVLNVGCRLSFHQNTRWNKNHREATTCKITGFVRKSALMRFTFRKKARRLSDVK